MARKLNYGDWAQVIGTYDLASRSGSILSMLPANLAFESLAGSEDRVRLKGVDEQEKVLFDLAVNPLRPSCGPVGTTVMFEEFVPVTDRLRYVKLFVDGVETSHYAPGTPPPTGSVDLANPVAGREHHIPLSSTTTVEPNITYILQVRPDGDTRWHTMAAGIDRPDEANVDINQFPGASAIDVRILQSNGFQTTTILEKRHEF
jgi:hypothetical protein